MGRRVEVFRRDGKRSGYCGELFRPEELTLDHVQPRLRGGDASDGNLVACCVPCNTATGGQAAWSYLASRPEQRENFLKYATGVWPRLRRAVEEAAQKK
jgi:hypothetical protein